jgi:hypothetical protein
MVLTEKQRAYYRAWYARNAIKICARQRAWRANNIAKERARGRACYNKNKEKGQARSKKWRQENRDKFLKSQQRSNFKGLYGITIEQRDALLQAQGSRCAACGSPTPQSKIGWVVDHCHVTGKIRGILCHPCNTGLGMTKDNPERLRNLAKYIEKFQCQT